MNIPENIVRQMLESIGLYADKPMWLTLVDPSGIELPGMRRQPAQPMKNGKGWGKVVLDIPEMPDYPITWLRRVWIAVTDGPHGDVLISSPHVHFDVPNGGTIDVDDINVGFALGMDVRKKPAPARRERRGLSANSDARALTRPRERASRRTASYKPEDWAHSSAEANMHVAVTCYGNF